MKLQWGALRIGSNLCRVERKAHPVFLGKKPSLVVQVWCAGRVGGLRNRQQRAIAGPIGIEGDSLYVAWPARHLEFCTKSPRTACGCSLPAKMPLREAPALSPQLHSLRAPSRKTAVKPLRTQHIAAARARDGRHEKCGLPQLGRCGLPPQLTTPARAFLP